MEEFKQQINKTFETASIQVDEAEQRLKQWKVRQVEEEPFEFPSRTASEVNNHDEQDEMSAKLSKIKKTLGLNSE